MAIRVFTFLKQYTFLFLLLVLSLPAVFALFHTGFFTSDDGEWMIIRLSAFYETLRSGELPVRFIGRLNNGYGYPLGDFMYPGFLYLGSLIHIIGFGFIKSIKILFGVSLIGSSIFVYFWLSKLFTKQVAFFAALVSLYLPYHLYDVYTRGSLGEVLALCVVPFILWQMERKDLVLTAFSIGFLILAHNTLAFLFVVPLYMYLVLRSKESWVKRVTISSSPFIFGALLTIFFWLPALYDLRYTVFSSVTISDWQKYFADISLIGYSTFLIFLVGTGTFFLYKNKKLPFPSVSLFFLMVVFISIVLSSSVSFVFWNIFPSSFIQFPFRLLSFLIPSVAYLIAMLLTVWFPKKQLLIGGIVVLFVFLLSYPYIFSKGFTNNDEMYYISNFSTTTVKNEYMPIWAHDTMPGTDKKVLITKGRGELTAINQKGNKISFQTNLSKPSQLQINSVYFPGWEVVVDGKPIKITPDPKYGLLQITIPAGQHTVFANFGETPIRLVTDIISLLVGIILVVLLFTKVRYNAIKLQ